MRTIKGKLGAHLGSFGLINSIKSMILGGSKEGFVASETGYPSGLVGTARHPTRTVDRTCRERNATFGSGSVISETDELMNLSSVSVNQARRDGPEWSSR